MKKKLKPDFKFGRAKKLGPHWRVRVLVERNLYRRVAD